jgi:hypothetical protein
VRLKDKARRRLALSERALLSLDRFRGIADDRHRPRPASA